jgi:hypothetical protein
MCLLNLEQSEITECLLPLILEYFPISGCYTKKYLYGNVKPISVVARSKAWVCIRLTVGIEGSNPAVGIDVCLLWVFVLR